MKSNALCLSRRTSRHMSRRLAVACWSMVFVCLAMAAGCSDPNIGIVSGSVMIDGEPAETGSITFAAEDGLTGPIGTMIADGKYSVELPIGMAKVEIRVPVVVGQKKLYNTPDSPVSDVMEESLPPRYNDETELTYDVVPGESVKDFELSRKMKKPR